jgi:hypothetical protein
MTNNAGPNLKEISQMLNIVCTKKDKSVLEVSIKNPYMLGFPLVASDKFITIFIQNGYTVALIEQVTPPPEPKRKCTNVFSPSTFISSTPNVDTNYAVCLYLEYESQKLKKQTQINTLPEGLINSALIFKSINQDLIKPQSTTVLEVIDEEERSQDYDFEEEIEEEVEEKEDLDAELEKELNELQED